LSANEALLLIGHGSARYPDAAGAMIRHAEALRAANRFAQVEVALLNGAPSVPHALARIRPSALRVVPFFMEDGYFTRVAVPLALGDRPAIICPPAGVHDGMAGLIERHALTACQTMGVPSRTAAIVVAGHGSASDPGQALALHRHAARVAATELFARVETACLEEAPFVADVLHGLRAHTVAIVGFFASHGAHVRDDLPALVAAEQAARRQMTGDDSGRAVRFHGCVADDPMMIEIIMDQAANAPAAASASLRASDSGELEMFAYVGGYTTPDRDGRGNGINVYRVDEVIGGWTHLQNIGELENPSLFTLNRASTRLYSVHGGRNLISAFAIDRQTGALTLLNQVDCQGNNPVDSALDPTERFLVIANYGTGAVAVMPIDQDGRLLPVSQVIPLEGTPGPDPKQQASSHPHAVIFDPTGQFVIVPDKGFDRTFFFRFQDGILTPTEQRHVDSAPGAAPRHTTFHPTLPVLYVNNELDSTVAVFDWAGGRATERQVVSTVPQGHADGVTGGDAGPNTTAEIAASPCGRYLYVSNRGLDSIVQFVVTPGSGLLTYAGSVPTGGAKPRFFTLGPRGKHLYAANQDSDDITVFHVDQESGSLIPTGIRVSVSSPSAISFVTPP
jgi:6-phosphogluconolactonase (cycloisomerase 2 family)/sirohydrochlorin ferrochelatase